MLNPDIAPCSEPMLYRSYSHRKDDGTREDWEDVTRRSIGGLAALGGLTQQEEEALVEAQLHLQVITSGRCLWVSGKPWFLKPENFYGGYNCAAFRVENFYVMAFLMNLAMQGCGTGAVLEEECVQMLPPILNRINIQIKGEPGDSYDPAVDFENTDIHVQFEGGKDGDYDTVSSTIKVGDSRQGWVRAYHAILAYSAMSFGREEAANFSLTTFNLTVDLAHVRPKGCSLKGFGGVSNPVGLRQVFERIVKVLNGAVGRKLRPLEVCFLIDEAASAVVAGNIRRSAGLREFSADDEEAGASKLNLWQQDESGSWRIDPERDALRMANHTRVFHRKPTLKECIDSVALQFSSGEGALMYAVEAVMRSNADLIPLKDFKLRNAFVTCYEESRDKAAGFLAERYLMNYGKEIDGVELDHRMQRYALNPCAEIIGNNFLCNLAEVHLINLDPLDVEAQKQAFRLAALSVCTLLNHELDDEVAAYSRSVDPIVGVSFTGLFDFFVAAFGVGWLEWWQAGRPRDWTGSEAPPPDYETMSECYLQEEGNYLSAWKEAVFFQVKEYCERQGLRVPNRSTTVQPAGSKSLITNSSPGWHPPKSKRFIRRMTFRRNDPVALACMDYGHRVIPSQSNKDENGVWLSDPEDPRCTEWLVEFPVQVPWANLPGVEHIEVEQFSALAQFDFFMQVQQQWTTHATSATLELREDEIEPLARAIHEAIQNGDGYISAALLARTDAQFPGLPFEPISKEVFEQLRAEVEERRVPGISSITEALKARDSIDYIIEPQDPACSSQGCELEAIPH